MQIHIFQLKWQLNWQAPSPNPVSYLQAPDHLKRLFYHLPTVNHPISLSFTLKYATQTHVDTHNTILLAAYTHMLIGKVLTCMTYCGHLIIWPFIYCPVIHYQSMPSAVCN